jgi:hypothetical protein
MATESILNTDILIRDRACVRFFVQKSSENLYFVPKGGDFVALFGPHGGALATFFAKMTNARQTPGGGGTHGID